jgi:hypothetical protein
MTGGSAFVMDAKGARRALTLTTGDAPAIRRWIKAAIS